MIKLKVTDGRTLTFEPGHTVDEGIRSAPTMPLVVSAQEENFVGVAGPSSGPDLLLIDPNQPNSVVAVEIKPSRPKGYVKSLATPFAETALRRVFPDLDPGSELSIARQLWVLNVGTGSLYVHAVSEDGRVGEVTPYRLVDVSSVANDEKGTDSILAGEDRVSTHSVARRVDDWVGRITALYADILERARRIDPAYEADTSSTITMSEDLMRRYGVPPRAVPTLQLKRDKQVELTLRPYGLWTIGGNGRIDVFGRGTPAFLIDQAERFASPRWVLYGSGGHQLSGHKIRDGVPLSDEVLRFLLRG